MTMKSLLTAGSLTLISLGVASAKSYDITLSDPVKAGEKQLNAGNYHLRIDGDQATFINTYNNKSVAVPVKLEHSGKKYSQTSVKTVTKDGVESLSQISLEGSDTIVDIP